MSIPSCVAGKMSCPQCIDLLNSDLDHLIASRSLLFHFEQPSRRGAHSTNLELNDF